MANIPSVKTYDQLLGEALSTYQSKIGVTDLNPGSAIVSFFESNAQMVYRVTGDVFQILKDYSIDRATGDSLKRLAQEDNIILKPAKAATSYVTIKDTSFEKVASKIYAGAKAPNAGSTTISIGDITGFPSSGSVYIGRGTTNVEGPVVYTSITSVGSYYQLNLASPTVKFHNISESVILAQGGVRTISPNTIVQTSSTGGTTPVKFSVSEQYLILDGETEVFQVPIVAQIPSIEGNVARNAIKEFIVAPFTGATVTNPSPITNGRNDEDDESLRIRVKQARASKGLGTVTAIKSAISGATSSEESASVSSSELITTGGLSTLYIDDGTGYERKTNGVGVEYIVDSALGGENSFQLATGGTQTGIAKASITSGYAQPFGVSAGERLSVLVGGTLSEHVFGTTDFKSNGAATAYEIVASINANYNLLFRATTSSGGTKVTLEAKEETDEFIQITIPSSGIDSAPYFNFPSEEAETLKLFKNDSPLSANGRTAYLNSMAQTYWSNTITTGETLTISVDGTPEQTYTITDQDFSDNTDYSIVSSSNSLEAWCAVLNAKIPGITATVDGLTFRITSNRQKSSLASISINPLSSFIGKNIFSTSQSLIAVGATKDYTFSRNTGQIKLVNPLTTKDTLTAGSYDSLARLKSGEILGATVSIPTGGGDYWVFVDDQTAAMVNTTLVGNTVITVTPNSALAGNGMLFETADPVFTKVQVGDYVIVWSEEFDISSRLEGRIIYKTNTQIVLGLTQTEMLALPASQTVTYQAGVVFIRSETSPQRISLSAGTYNINELADTMNAQLKGAYFEIEKDSIFILRSSTMNSSEGSILIPTVTANLISLNLPIGITNDPKTSQNANYETPYDIDYIPAFAHTELYDAHAYPSASYISTLATDIDFSLAGIDPNEIISFLNGYSGLKDQPLNEIVQIDSYSFTNVNIEQSEFIKRVRDADRAYIAHGYQFGANDSLIVVLDNNSIEKTFIIPLYREITTNSTIPVSATAFNAYDTEYGPTGNLVTSFGSDFSFDNYKVLLKAKTVLDQYGAENAILYRSAMWGKSGEYCKISYEYPTNTNTDISHNVTVDQDTTIKLFLKSGNSISTSQDGVTEWDVTITPNTPLAGIDQVTYTWNGVGADPALTLSGGEYVKILDTGTFNSSNIGTFRVSTQSGFLPTGQSFTVQRKNGVAVSETAAANIVPSTISFYNYVDTTANDMVTYVNTNLSNYITAEIVNDSGMGGTGRITLSTYEATKFIETSIYLKDGINWIKTTDLTSSPQFIFKNNLSYFSSGGYTFNNAEKIRLIPTTPKQVVDMMNTLAISGVSTLAKITTSNKGKKVQIATNTLGSSGAVQIIGGGANDISVDVIDTSTSTSSLYGKTFVSSSSLSPISSGQLLKITSSNVQEKLTDIEFLNTIEINPGYPLPTQTEITIGNRQTGQRLFNIPRTHQNMDGNTWKVEKQGGFTCLSWTGDGNNPLFHSSAQFNLAFSDTINYVKSSTSNYLDITIVGAGNFQDVVIGDIITIIPDPLNLLDPTHLYSGTFEIQGVSVDQKTIRILSPEAITSMSVPISSVGMFNCQKSIKTGDTLRIIGLPFNPLNHGSFRVVKVFENSVYYESVNFAEETVTTTSTPIDLVSAASPFLVTPTPYAAITYTGIGLVDFRNMVKVGDRITLGSNFSLENQGVFTVIGVDQDTLQFINGAAVVESVIGGVTYFTPSVIFHEYDAAVEQDNLVMRGSFFGNNVGSYPIAKVLNENTVVINEVLEAKALTSLAANSDNIFLEEQTPYTGYKKVRMVTIEPSNPNLGIIIWENNYQIDKINSLSGATISAVSKLRFPNVNKQGFDAYRYDIGLLSEVNKIVYGDPRDRSTYPGVAAAGVEIFINPPLVKRVSVGIVVRLNTGIPLVQVVEQVRNSVASLIDSNPIGQSIAISKIVAAVDAIPGVRAMAITSPQYDQTNDLISIQSNEKSLVVDVSTDIAVSQLG